MSGRLNLKPGYGPNLYPEDDALFLTHGRGLCERAGHVYSGPLEPAALSRFGIDAPLARRIDDWAAIWRDLADGLGRNLTPEHCREFDIQSYNREALAICRAVAAHLPETQELCYYAAKRKGARYKSEMLAVQPPPKVKSSDYYDRDPSKWLRVMGDYGSSCLWGEHGEMDAADLPVSEALRQRLKAWARRFFTHNDSWYDGDADNFARLQDHDRRLRAFSDEGVALARAVKFELPDWTVVYFDTDLAGRYNDRAVYQFEVTEGAPLGEASAGPAQ